MKVVVVPLLIIKEFVALCSCLVHLVICFSIFYTPIVLFLLLIEKGVRIEVRLPVVGDIITMIIQIE